MTTKNVEARMRYLGKDDDRSNLAHEITYATSYATPGLADLAEALGVTRDSISSWRQGRRTPTRESVAVLADELRSRGERLLGIAESLSKIAEDEIQYALRRLPQAVWKDIERLDRLQTDIKRWLQNWIEDNPDRSIQEGALAWLEGRAEELADSVTSVDLDRSSSHPAIPTTTPWPRRSSASTRRS